VPLGIEGMNATIREVARTAADLESAMTRMRD
jgi:hypothetical protein